MPALLDSEATSSRQAEEAIMHLLQANRGRFLTISKVLRQARNAASVDEGTARRAVLRLAADHRAVLNSMLKISLAE